MVFLTTEKHDLETYKSREVIQMFGRRQILLN